jgi:hypothetical protein
MPVKIRLDRSWYKRCSTEEDKERRTQSITAGLHLFEDLRELLLGQIDAQQGYVESPNRLANPNWDNETAYELGRIRGVRDAIDLIPRTANQAED